VTTLLGSSRGADAERDRDGASRWGLGMWALGAVLAIALAGLALWQLPSILADGAESLTEKDRLAAESRERDIVLKAIGGLAIIIGLFYTAQTVRVATNTLELSRQTFVHSRQTQLTERFKDAVGHLGDNSPNVRVGAIMLLSSIAREDSTFETPVTEIMVAFLRDRADPKAKGGSSPAGGGSAGRRRACRDTGRAA
jgi:hypothetical protein